MLLIHGAIGDSIARPTTIHWHTNVWTTQDPFHKMMEN